jgi:hypothetical protein
MLIQHDEKTGTIVLNDGYKVQYRILLALIIINGINGVINGFYNRLDDLGVISFFWMLILVVSLILLFYFLIKKTAKSKIPVLEVKKLKVNTRWGKKKYSLELSNGKIRDLPKFERQEDIDALLKAFGHASVAVSLSMKQPQK